MKILCERIVRTLKKLTILKVLYFLVEADKISLKKRKACHALSRLHEVCDAYDLFSDLVPLHISQVFY